MEELSNNNIRPLLDEEYEYEKTATETIKESENDKISPDRTHEASLLRHLKRNDYAKLKGSALSRGGLLRDDLRRKIWPKLLKLDIFPTSPKPSAEVIESHQYYTQVVMDVNRSLKRFPPSIAERQRLSMQDQLVALIMRVLIKHPDLHYYQGYHDICVTFLLVLGEEIAFAVVEKLSTTKLRLFMDETMQRTSDHLQHIYPLIGRISPKLRQFLDRSEVGVMFCLSWVITWYGHVLENYNAVVRMFDLFLASHAWMPLYVAAAIVQRREKDILEQECDMACVHGFLARLTDNLPFEDVICDARELYKKFPPNLLEKDLKEENRRRIVTRSNRQSVMALVSCLFPYSSKALSFVIVVAAVVIYQIYKRYK